MLKREKTAVSVDLSDGEKEALYQQLINEQTALNQKLTRDHLKHEQQVHDVSWGSVQKKDYQFCGFI